MCQIALSVSVRLVWWIASEMSEVDMFGRWTNLYLWNEVQICFGRDNIYDNILELARRLISRLRPEHWGRVGFDEDEFYVVEVRGGVGDYRTRDPRLNVRRLSRIQPMRLPEWL